MPAKVSRPKPSIEILLGSGTDVRSITVAAGILIVDSNNAQKRLPCVAEEIHCFLRENKTARSGRQFPHKARLDELSRL